MQRSSTPVNPSSSSANNNSFAFSSQTYQPDHNPSPSSSKVRRRSSALSLSSTGSQSGMHSRQTSQSYTHAAPDGFVLPNIVVRGPSIVGDGDQRAPGPTFAAGGEYGRNRGHVGRASSHGHGRGLGPAFEVKLDDCVELASPTPSHGFDHDSSDERESYDPLSRYSPSTPISPPDSPSKDDGRSAFRSTPPKQSTSAMKRSRVYKYGTPDKKVSRNYRDRTPPARNGPESPIYGFGESMMTPEGSPVRGSSPGLGRPRLSDTSSLSRSSSDEELPTSLHGNNPNQRGVRRTVTSAINWFAGMGGAGAMNAISSAKGALAMDRRRSSGVSNFAGVAKTGGKYIDKDEIEGGISFKQSKSSRRKRNALILGAVIVIGYVVFAGVPSFGGGGSAIVKPTRSSISAKYPSGIGKVRSKLRGKAQKVQSTTSDASDSADSTSHILDGLPADLLSYGRHPIDHRDGTLVVNASLPAAAHPIYQLIRDSREKWDRKVKRQSKTLKQAVVEYRRRNGGMNPPKGFDRWWKFCVDHDIPLPDEYDQINNDLRIFRALSPRELAARVERASALEDTFTISVTSGSIRTRAGYAREIGGADERVSGQVQLLEDFGIQSWLPDFKAVYGIHDTPTGVIEWSHRRDLLERVDDDEYYQNDEELDFMKRGLVHACPPNSLTGQQGEVYEDPSQKQNKTFISNPSQTFDLCQHPNYFPIHGITLDKSPHMDKELKAVFSLSKTSLNTDVLGVPVEQFMDNLAYIPWDERKADRLLWRGSNTGSYASGEYHWRQTQRLRLVGETSPKERGVIDLLPAPGSVMKGTIEQSMMKVNKGTVNAITMDITFAGLPIQCNQEDGTCDELAKEYNFNLAHMTHDEALQYKYILDVDGNSWSARTRRLFAGGSLIFKSTIMPEWWTERAQAWVHYVPINIDYSDMHDALLFFRGDIYGRGGEDALAKEIAQAGVDWANSSWRKVDMAAYAARLYLEWARLLAPSRSGSDFVYHPSMEISRGEA